MRRFALATAVLLAASPGLSGAQAPIIEPDPDPNFLGRYVITIATPAVLDYTRTTVLDAGGNVTTTMMVQDVRGRVEGTMSTSGPAINSEGIVHGRVSTRQGLPLVRLRMKEEGTVGDDVVRVVGKLTARLEGWGPEATMVGQLVQRYCAIITDPIRDRKKKLCTLNRPSFEEPAPDAGTWEVRLALEQVGRSVIGAGSISTGFHSLAPVRTVDVTVSGKISASSGLATVRLQSMDESVILGGATLIGPLAEDPDGSVHFSAVHEVRGKILGQALDEVFDSVP